MEANESILTRSIVGLDERKVLGKMSSLRVDYDTQAVSHYIVMNASTNNAIALPFENAIAVGDTFITVQSYGSFVDANSPASKELVSDANKLVGVEVYSRTGNNSGHSYCIRFRSSLRRHQEHHARQWLRIQVGCFPLLRSRLRIRRRRQQVSC